MSKFFNAIPTIKPSIDTVDVLYEQRWLKFRDKKTMFASRKPNLKIDELSH